MKKMETETERGHWFTVENLLHRLMKTRSQNIPETNQKVFWRGSDSRGYVSAQVQSSGSLVLTVSFSLSVPPKSGKGQSLAQRLAERYNSLLLQLLLCVCL